MKNLLKYSFWAVLFLAVACNNAPTTKEEKVVSATTSTTPQKEVPKTTPTATNTEEEKASVELIEVEEIKKETPRTDVTKTVTHPKTKDVAQAVEVVKATPKKEKVVSETKVETPNKAEMPKEKTPTKPVMEETAKEETATSEKTTTEPKKEVIKSKPTAFSHDAWNKLAQKHISSTGKVNYKGFKTDIAEFDAYLKSLSENPVQSSWSRAKKMAYWINAYNAYTIKLIVDNYPVKSITNLEGGKPWDKKWIKLGDKTYSLNNIEHDILRPKYKDARIHFAVNCAAKSCPPVWNKAWTEQNLEGRLERAAKSFINNEKYNKIGAKEVAISKIFDWYKEDFGKIVDYLNQYADTKINDGAEVTYKEYNWALNE